MTEVTQAPPENPTEPRVKSLRGAKRRGPFKAPCDFCWYFGDNEEKTVVELDDLNMCRECCLSYVQIGRE